VFSLSQTSGYAIFALGCMEGPGGRLVLSKDIAKRTSIPLPYLQKLLHQLSAGGLIVSRRGYQGGWLLARQPSEINLLEVAKAVDPELATPRCLIGLKQCSDETACPVHHLWIVERERIYRLLAGATLADIEGRPITGLIPAGPQTKVNKPRARRIGR
jgi:Rrf2 family iron-sulfur cluster assembly transcriptional regulator